MISRAAKRFSTAASAIGKSIDNGVFKRAPVINIRKASQSDDE
jgi:hypothetical protein